jgi:nicotinate-nucleotide adenylyltransferase
LFGGTFDPPHLGHLALAEWARERLGLDHVLFVPAGQPPHKPKAAVSAAAARLAMTRLATRGNRAFRVSTIELGAAKPSFTIDTVRRLTRGAPRTHWYLLIGADSLDDFRTWHEPDGILQHMTLAVAGRPGAGSRRSLRWAKDRPVVWIGNPGLDVSSSMIRERARNGRSIRYLVPDLVARFIAERRLYRKRAR